MQMISEINFTPFLAFFVLIKYDISDLIMSSGDSIITLYMEVFALKCFFSTKSDKSGFCRTNLQHFAF